MYWSSVVLKIVPPSIKRLMGKYNACAANKMASRERRFQRVMVFSRVINQKANAASVGAG
jgi:hypothetical protein